ncbi:MAG: AbrB/MazE/SpoVT family DNA-binding domain-containing protein [Candidatus Rokubacteria bacterium]|nr:AbrB/MazE/SpoVT family DNA-binding domain-containing protein [Candidatus Rokubacteria bacterium]MBI3107613.1 AbrB/MazE/SpoVT family DNA-binding domain-containing protein [Candidatus Rokubacteria bacterium]
MPPRAWCLPHPAGNPAGAGKWEGPKDGPIIHLDSALLLDGKIYCAHSNWDEWPMTRSVEIWDAETTTLVVSPRGQITLPRPVRARLRLGPGSVLLLREEAGKIVLDPAAVTPVQPYSDEEIERLIGVDRPSPRERVALRRRWSLKAGGRRRRPNG